MPKVSASSCVRPKLAARRCSRHLAAVYVPMAMVLCLSTWIASEWCWLRREQEATAVLERDYHAGVIASIYSSEPDRIFADQCIDLRALRRGRLYVPVTMVSMHSSIVDRRAWQELASFRYLEDLTVQDCRIEPTTELGFPNAGHLKALRLVDTVVKVSDLRAISKLNSLERLTLDATGLTGDWLRYVSELPEIESFTLNNGDLAEDEGDSLARMKGLTTLQLVHVKIDFKLGPVIASLEKLENLVIEETPFDDEDMKHLTALKHLRILFLGSTAITDSGMVSLDNLPSLWRLSVNNTKVGDAGLRHLSRLQRLGGLDIRGTQATNSCLRTLAAIPSLKATLIKDTSISASSAGFIGVLCDGAWYADEARAKEAGWDSEDCIADTKVTQHTDAE